MTITISHMHRYPVKGLPADRVARVDLTPDQPMPFDRRYGMAHASSRIDKASPEWAPKNEFLMLARDEKLAELGASFDEATETLTILRKGKQVSKGALTSASGRSVLQTFLAGFMPDGPRGNPTIVEAPKDNCFSDVPGNWLSIINLASVADIGRVLQRSIDPLRFRGNLYIDAPKPWIEAEWPGKRLKIGEVELSVEEPIGRCAATNIDPTSGQADLNIPLTLRKGFGHTKCGVYVRVRQGGTIREGQEIEII